MNKKLIIFLACFLMLAPLAAEPIALEKEAELAFQNRHEQANAIKSLEIFEKLLIKNPANVSFFWRASRAAWWAGDRSPKKKEKKKFFQKGIEYAKQAVVLDPNSAEAHFWLAGNYGSFGEAKGILKSLSLVKPIRKELAEVIRINPAFEGGGAQRILGIMDYKIPKIGGGDKERALVQLTESYNLDPAHPATLYYLGEYFKVIKKKEKAKEYLLALKNLPVEGWHKSSVITMQEKGEKLLKKISR